MGKVEDILETVRRYAEAGKISAEEILRRFPELKESEDERIRKAILKLVKKHSVNHERCQMEVYLEKQKEQNESICDDLAEEIDRISKRYPEVSFAKLSRIAVHFAKWQKEQKPTEHPDDKVDEEVELTPFESALFSAFSDAWQEFMRGENVNVAQWAKEHSEELLEVAKEDSAKWSKEEKEIIGNLRHILNAYAFEHSGLDVNGDYIKQDYIDADNWLKSLRERVNLQPKQEWSEEDDYRIRWIISLLTTMREKGVDDRFGDSVFDDIPDMIAWLKSLRPKPKQEWSDGYREDELRTRIAFYTYKDEYGILYLSNLFVEETSRNQGFGTKILKAAEKFAEAIGAISIRLKVKQDSPANAWYRKNGYGYMTFEDGYDWLEKTLEYLKPKREWSEEDERRFEVLMAMCDDRQNESSPTSTTYREMTETKDWLKNRFKSLRPQPKQEWNEETEEDSDIICEIIDHCVAIPYIGGTLRLSDERKKGLKTFVKSLRPQPHWKPTEEQMKALENVIKCELSAGLHTRAEILQTLQNELKKL